MADKTNNNDQVRYKNELLNITVKEPKYRLKTIQKNLNIALDRKEVINWTLKNIDFKPSDIERLNELQKQVSWLKSMVEEHYTKGTGQLKFYNRSNIIKMANELNFSISVLGKELIVALEQMPDVDPDIMKEYGFPGINIETSDEIIDEKEEEEEVKNLTKKPKKKKKPLVEEEPEEEEPEEEERPAKKAKKSLKKALKKRIEEDEDE